MNHQQPKTSGLLAGIMLFALMLFAILLMTSMFGLPDGARNVAIVAAGVTALAVAI